MLNDYQPILHTAPRTQEEMHLYFLHDAHMVNAEHSTARLNAFLQKVADDPAAQVLVIGDG